MEIETRVIHGGRGIDPATGAVSSPIHLSTTFERAPDGSYPQGYIYSRTDNPNRAALEECLRDMEGGQGAAAFSSGMAAITAVFQALSAGDHVVAPRDVYHGTARVLRGVMSRWNLDATFVDMTDLDLLRKAMRPSTRMVFVENPVQSPSQDNGHSGRCPDCP